MSKTWMPAFFIINETAGQRRTDERNALRMKDCTAAPRFCVIRETKSPNARITVD